MSLSVPDPVVKRPPRNDEDDDKDATTVVGAATSTTTDIDKLNSCSSRSFPTEHIQSSPPLRTPATASTTTHNSFYSRQGSSSVAPPRQPAAISEEQMQTFEKQCQEHKLGCLLVAISVMFIICQSFKLFPDIYEVVHCYNMDTETECSTSSFVNKIVDLSHLLVCINSSANFLIYLLGGEKFRRAWIETYVPDCLLKMCGCERILAQRRRRNSCNNCYYSRSFKRYGNNSSAFHKGSGDSGSRQLIRMNTMQTFATTDSTTISGDLSLIHI